MEEHEIKIADKYITWGWRETEKSDLDSKIVPIGIIKPIKKRKPSRKNAVNLLIVTYTGPRYVLRCETGRNIPYYISFCLSFADCLVGSNPYHNTIIRLLAPGLLGNPHNYGWDEEKRWQDQHPNLIIDNGLKPIRQLEKSAKLVVQTIFGSTGFLENIVANIPCIVLDMEEPELLREEVLPYIDELKNVGIYHHSTKSAAEHVKIIWNDVDAWWESDEVQTVLERFKNKFCKKTTNQLFEIHKLLKDS
jgi:putative transferase (TIGR04331 family)